MNNIPIFDDTPFDAKSYAEEWRRKNPNYQQEYRLKQIALFGKAYFDRKKRNHKKWRDALPEWRKKELREKARVFAADFKKIGNNAQLLRDRANERYANMSVEKREAKLERDRERYAAMTPEVKEIYLAKGRARAAAKKLEAQNLTKGNVKCLKTMDKNRKHWSWQ